MLGALSPNLSGREMIYGWLIGYLFYELFWKADDFLILSIIQLSEAVTRGVPGKSCSENMQNIYWRTPMPKCDFHKFAKQIYMGVPL